MDMYHNGQDSIAKELAIEELRNFINKLIHRYYPTYMKDYEDLFNAGVLGIIKSLPKYDPKKGAPTTYFYSEIMHEMTGFIVGEKKTSRHYSTHIAIIMKAINRFAKANKEYDITDICIDTNLPYETVKNCLTIADRTSNLSIESDSFVDANTSERSLSPEDEVIKKQETEAIHRVINKELTEIEAIVIKNAFGFYPQELKPAALAEKLGISLEDVKKAKHLAIKKIRQSTSLKPWFKDNYSHSETKSLNENEMALVPIKNAKKAMDELEFIQIDF